MLVVCVFGHHNVLLDVRASNSYVANCIAHTRMSYVGRLLEFADSNEISFKWRSGHVDVSTREVNRGKIPLNNF